MTGPTTPVASWLADLTQLLDEHHLAVLSDDPERRNGFARALTSHLGGLTDAQVVRIEGRQVVDEPSFAAAVGTALDRPCRSIEDVIEVLRDRSRRVRLRYIVWIAADELLERHVSLFGRAAEAIMATAAEHEHVADGPLVIQRAVFFGGSKLGAYAEEDAGQFNRWREGPGDEIFRPVRECVARPPVLCYRLDG